MATRRILVILIILYQHTILLRHHGVNARMTMLSNYNLFQDFLEANKLNYGIFTTCGIGNDGGVESQVSKLIENLKNVSTRISFSENFNQLEFYASGIYLNLKCEMSKNILKLASTNKLFNSTQKWLLVSERGNGNHKEEQEVMEILENLDINLNSNVNIALEG